MKYAMNVKLINYFLKNISHYRYENRLYYIKIKITKIRQYIIKLKLCQNDFVYQDIMCLHSKVLNNGEETFLERKKLQCNWQQYY